MALTTLEIPASRSIRSRQRRSHSHWIEGGDPGNVDRRGNQDRHLLIVDRDRNHLYELFNVYYDSVQGKWFAGSGAFFDMNTNNRRPDTWTSADAAGLAILPGLVRYDEVYDPNLTRNSPCVSGHGACDQRLCVSGVTSSRFDCGCTAHGRALAFEGQCRC